MGCGKVMVGWGVGVWGLLGWSEVLSFVGWSRVLLESTSQILGGWVGGKNGKIEFMIMSILGTVLPRLAVLLNLSWHCPRPLKHDVVLEDFVEVYEEVRLTWLDLFVGVVVLVVMCELVVFSDFGELDLQFYSGHGGC